MGISNPSSPRKERQPQQRRRLRRVHDSKTARLKFIKLSTAATALYFLIPTQLSHGYLVVFSCVYLLLLKLLRASGNRIRVNRLRCGNLYLALYSRMYFFSLRRAMILNLNDIECFLDTVVCSDHYKVSLWCKREPWPELAFSGGGTKIKVKLHDELSQCCT